MSDFLFNLNSIIIAVALFALMMAAMWAGVRTGLKRQRIENEERRSQNNAVQASLLGVLALLLGFTFSMALQRFDERSKAVVEEANAIGTAFLRAGLLPEPLRGEAEGLLRDYVDLRIRASRIDLAHSQERGELLADSAAAQAALWQVAMEAVNADDRPTTTGLFLQALNQMIDHYGSRNAAVERHVPAVIMLLLFATFILLGGILGYSSGITGNRPTVSVYTMVLLIVLLVFVIIDLDRPRRGLIAVSQQSLHELKDVIQPAHRSGGS